MEWLLAFNAVMFLAVFFKLADAAATQEVYGSRVVRVDLTGPREGIWTAIVTTRHRVFFWRAPKQIEMVSSSPEYTTYWSWDQAEPVPFRVAEACSNRWRYLSSKKRKTHISVVRGQN